MTPSARALILSGRRPLRRPAVRAARGAVRQGPLFCALFVAHGGETKYNNGKWYILNRGEAGFVQ